MAVINCRRVASINFFRSSVLFIWNAVRLTFFSLFYNKFADWYYFGDTCMEPMFWLVDHFTKMLGPICVAAVVILSSSVIVIAYAVGLPFYIRWNIYMLTIAFIIGHWLLLNVIVYYYLAFITEPGYPPQGAMIVEAVSICKKCIAPKPPRTHHCNVCNRCILKMDHHCPWLNNCIGHFNHRYFFMFCVYSWAGVVFIMLFGIPVAYVHFFDNPQQFQVNNSSSNLLELEKRWIEPFHHSCIVYAALLCIAVFFVLGGLIAWHAKLISKGETSIESHINKKETERSAKTNKVYKNPYDLGPLKNWKIFLLIGDHRPWWHLLLPFAEKPFGDGLQWNSLIHDDCDMRSVQHELSRTCSVKLS